MNILVIGASGRTGQLVARVARQRAYIVTALVRPSNSVATDRFDKVIYGDPTSAADIAFALENQDAVISCLGQRSKADSRLLRMAAIAATEAMQSATVRRYIVISQGLLFPSRNPLVSLLRFILARHVADSIAMEEVVQASALDWTIVRPPRLLAGGKEHGYRASVGARPLGSASMQRADLATCLLDVVERPEYLRAIIGVTSA